MFAMRKTFELAVCLLGYWLGKGFGGWGGGIVLAFAGLLATSYGWERIANDVFGSQKTPTATMHFVFSAIAAATVSVAAFLLWGK